MMMMIIDWKKNKIMFGIFTYYDDTLSTLHTLIEHIHNRNILKKETLKMNWNDDDFILTWWSRHWISWLIIFIWFNFLKRTFLYSKCYINCVRIISTIESNQKMNERIYFIFTVFSFVCQKRKRRRRKIYVKISIHVFMSKNWIIKYVMNFILFQIFEKIKDKQNKKKTKFIWNESRKFLSSFDDPFNDYHV